MMDCAVAIGAKSSLVIVPVTIAVFSCKLLALLRVKVKVSSGSTVLSPLIFILMVFDLELLSKITVPSCAT
jgi:hypothetical protein